MDPVQAPGTRLLDRINLVVVQVGLATIGVGTPIFWAYAASERGSSGSAPGVVVFYITCALALAAAVLAGTRKKGIAAQLKSFLAHVFIYLSALLFVGGSLIMLMVR